MPTAPRQTQVLGSWKEIAAYLGKGVRTVQRWEQQFGLPVRRPKSLAKGVVFAETGELEEWLQSKWARRAGAMTAADGRSGHEELSQGIRTLRELRHANSEIIKDLMRNVQELKEKCEALTRVQARLEIDTTRARRRRA